MTDSARLGGFKVLKDVVRISLVSSGSSLLFPLELSRIIAGKKINLPYLTIVSHRAAWGIHLVVDAADRERTAALIDERFGSVVTGLCQSAILSIFPHKRNPEVSGRLLHAFDREGVEPDALASSPSAISVVVRENLLQSASRALFEPFSFGAYRTPEDWKAAQKGRERAFKEVVASYQEKRPGVYGLDYGAGQELVQVRVKKAKIARVGSSFRSLDCSGLHLAFLATSPCSSPGEEILSFCLPSSEGSMCKHVISTLSPGPGVDTVSPVMTFSVNGPHFGDRYGIISQFLTAMDKKSVSPLGLSCTVASITGVVAQEQSQQAIQAIRECFDVPAITKNP